LFLPLQKTNVFIDFARDARVKRGKMYRGVINKN
jgi:hypothetical protein